MMAWAMSASERPVHGSMSSSRCANSSRKMWLIRAPPCSSPVSRDASCTCAEVRVRVRVRVRLRVRVRVRLRVGVRVGLGLRLRVLHLRRRAVDGVAVVVGELSDEL